jgi:hypothetical protein
MAVTPKAAVALPSLGPALFGGVCLVLATTSAVPLVAGPSPGWIGACATLGLGVLFAAGMGWRAILGDTCAAVSAVLLLRLPMEGFVIEGKVVPGWSAVAAALIAPGGRSWSEGPAVITEAVDGTLEIHCDTAKCAVWEMAAVTAVLWLVLRRHGVGLGPVQAIIAPALLVAAMGVFRFVAISVCFCGTPNILVQSTPSPLSWFWRSDVTAGVFLVLSLPVIAVLSRWNEGATDA